mmetsp:Transcript_22599/g.57124  ORF Transcript_22599/g.57124 Transcript_22599/m.57124 type:complete len:319 (+) Transcript_22599:145-1101(+)
MHAPHAQHTRPGPGHGRHPPQVRRRDAPARGLDGPWPEDRAPVPRAALARQGLRQPERGKKQARVCQEGLGPPPLPPPAGDGRLRDDQHLARRRHRPEAPRVVHAAGQVVPAHRQAGLRRQLPVYAPPQGAQRQAPRLGLPDGRRHLHKVGAERPPRHDPPGLADPRCQEEQPQERHRRHRQRRGLHPRGVRRHQPQHHVPPRPPRRRCLPVRLSDCKLHRRPPRPLLPGLCRALDGRQEDGDCRVLEEGHGRGLHLHPRHPPCRQEHRGAQRPGEQRCSQGPGHWHHHRGCGGTPLRPPVPPPQVQDCRNGPRGQLG